MKKYCSITNEKVSVIVPIYNSQKTLNDCIKSVLNQTYKNFELILIDDGSSDNSRYICEEYERIDQRVKVFFQQNSGPSVARNVGIGNATGKYILFVDSDDYIENDMLYELIHNAEIENADLVVCGMIVDMYNLSGELVSSKVCKLTPRIINDNCKIPQNIIDLVENEKISGPYCKLIRRDIIVKHDILMPINIILQEDLYFSLKVLEYVNKLIVIEGCYYHYNKGSTKSITSRYFPNKYEMTNEVHDLLVNFYMNRCDEIDILKRINFIYVKNTYAAFINLFHSDCTMSKQKKLEYIKNIIKSFKYSNVISCAYKKGIKYNVLLFLLKTKNKNLLYYSSKIMNILKFNFGFSY